MWRLYFAELLVILYSYRMQAMGSSVYGCSSNLTVFPRDQKDFILRFFNLLHQLYLSNQQDKVDAKKGSWIFSQNSKLVTFGATTKLCRTKRCSRSMLKKLEALTLYKVIIRYHNFRYTHFQLDQSTVDFQLMFQNSTSRQGCHTLMRMVNRRQTYPCRKKSASVQTTFQRSAPAATENVGPC